MIIDQLNKFWYELFLIFKTIPFIFFQIFFLINVWIWFFSCWGIFDKKRLFIIIYILLSSVLLLMSLYFNSFNLGIVKQEKLDLYIGPDKTYPIKNFLKLNDEIIIEKEKLNSDKWFYVYYGDKKGWVPSQGIKILK